MSESLPMQSKKFLAYLVADIAWTALLGMGIWLREDEGGWDSSLLLAMVLVKGFVQTGYILSQAALDRYVRLAQIAKPGPKMEEKAEEKAEEPPKAPEEPKAE